MNIIQGGVGNQQIQDDYQRMVANALTDRQRGIAERLYSPMEVPATKVDEDDERTR